MATAIKAPIMYFFFIVSSQVQEIYLTYACAKGKSAHHGLLAQYPETSSDHELGAAVQSGAPTHSTLQR
jgi:hypothetical protein